MQIDRLQRPANVVDADEGRLRTGTFSWLLADVISKGESMADLGAGPCIFAKRGRDAGYKVTAVDGRNERIPDDLGEGIEFVQADIRNFVLDGFDVIAILGLLYHLTLEEQIDLIGRAKGATVILDTQIHDPAAYTDAASDEWTRTLVETNDGYSGILFPEGENPMASLEPQLSFWHTEESLLRMLDNAGFAIAQPVESQYISKYGARKFFVAA